MCLFISMKMVPMHQFYFSGHYSTFGPGVHEREQHRLKFPVDRGQSEMPFGKDFSVAFFTRSSLVYIIDKVG